MYLSCILPNLSLTTFRRALPGILHLVVILVYCFVMVTIYSARRSILFACPKSYGLLVTTTLPHYLSA